MPKKQSETPIRPDPAFKIHVLATETKGDLLKIIAGIKDYLQPRHYFEDLIVNRIANLTLDELRFIRIKTGVLNNAIKRVLEEVLGLILLPPSAEISSQKNREAALAAAFCVEFDEEQKRRVETMLEEFGHSWVTIEALAFNSVSDEIIKIDRLLKSASDARDRALRSIPRLRKDFPQQVRAASDAVLATLAGDRPPDNARFS